MSEQIPFNPNQEPERKWHRLSDHPENLRDLKTPRAAEIPGEATTREEWLNSEFGEHNWRFNEAEFAERNSEQLNDIYENNQSRSPIRMGYIEVTDEPLTNNQED